MTDSSQYVTLPIVRELLETQERSFKTMVQMFFESVKSEVRDIRKEVNDLKESLTFSQKDIEEAKSQYQEYRIEGYQDRWRHRRNLQGY